MTDTDTPSSQTNPSSSENKLSYRDAGVDIDAGNRLVDRIKSVAASTKRPEVLGSLGGFGALCEIPKNYVEPVLVSGTDGVGTKLKLAIDLGIHSGIGIDLVAMCANDLVVCGAEPLFFLDYYATGKLNVDTASEVITSISEGCKQAGCALVGGETAEMPGMYQGEDYDLAGFCVGVVEKSKIIDGSQVASGDQLIALASSGPHSNGYSLIRKVIELSGADLHQPFAGRTLAEVLLEPTRIYVKPLLGLIAQLPVKAICHITGGGFSENIPRVLPKNMIANIELESWKLPPVFEWLQREGNIELAELLRTFNCGAGIILCVDQENSQTALEILAAAGEQAWVIGDVTDRRNSTHSVNLVHR